MSAAVRSSPYLPRFEAFDSIAVRSRPHQSTPMDTQMDTQVDPAGPSSSGYMNRQTRSQKGSATSFASRSLWQCSAEQQLRIAQRGRVVLVEYPPQRAVRFPHDVP